MIDSLGLPLYATSFEEVLWGLLLVAVTMTVPGFGMLLTLRTSTVLNERFARRPSFSVGMGILILAGWMITLVHLFDVVGWAAFFL